MDTSKGFGFALGCTDAQSFIGWFTDVSTAITDGLSSKDNTPGTVARWFRQIS